MEEFKIIKSVLNDSINVLREKIKKLYEKEKKYKEEKEFIEKLLEEYDGKTDINFSNRKKREIIKYYPFMEEEIIKYELLLRYKEVINMSKFNLIKPDIFLEITKNIVPTIDKEQLLKDIDYCINTKKVLDEQILTDDDLEERLEQEKESIINRINILLKENIRLLFEKIKISFKEKYSNIEEELESIESIKKQISELKELDIFDEKGNVKRFFKDKEELKKFYEWMKNNVDLSIQLEAIPLITKQGLLITQKEREEVVDKNRESIIEDLQESLLDKDKIDLEKLDLSSYNDEEKQIVINGLKAYEELRIIEKERNDIITEDDKENKELMYLYDDRYNWDIVLYDIEHNLLPNISTDKENVLNSFKLINDLYNRQKEEQEKRLLILNEIIGDLEQYQDLISFVEKYGTSQYDYIIENKIKEDSKDYPSGVSYERVEMSYFINHTVKKEIEMLSILRREIEERIRQRKIIKSDNDGINLDELEERFDSIYESADSKVSIYKEILQGTYVKVNDEEKEKTTTNLVFCICDTEEDDEKEYQEDYRKAYELLAHRKHWTISDKVHELWKKSHSGKKVKYEIPGVKMKRIRALGDSRVGLAIFDVSKEIMEKLKERYNLGEDARVYGLFNAITPGANHNTYIDLSRNVSHNTKFVSLIAQLLNGNNVDIEQIFKMIDFGIERRDTILNDTDGVKKHE